MKEIINLQLEGLSILKKFIDSTFDKGLSNVEKTKEEANSILNMLDHHYITNLKYFLFEIIFYLDNYQKSETNESINNIVNTFCKLTKNIDNYYRKLSEKNTNISCILAFPNKELLEVLTYKEYELINMNITVESNYSKLSYIERSYYYDINKKNITYEQSFIPNKAISNYKHKEIAFGKVRCEAFIDNNLLYLKSIKSVEKINDYSFIEGNTLSESIKDYKNKLISSVDCIENMFLCNIHFKQIFEKQGKLFLQDDNNMIIELVSSHIFYNDNHCKNLFSIIDSTNLKNNILFCGLVYDGVFKLIPITIIEENQLIRL